jgi:hypothetical protein
MADHLRCRHERFDRAQNYFAVGVNDLLEGRPLVPSAGTVWLTANRLRCPHDRFALRENDLACGASDLPDSKTFPPSANI